MRNLQTLVRDAYYRHLIIEYYEVTGETKYFISILTHGNELIEGYISQEDYETIKDFFKENSENE